jgi:hypothetical protein
MRHTKDGPNRRFHIAWKAGQASARVHFARPRAVPALTRLRLSQERVQGLGTMWVATTRSEADCDTKEPPCLDWLTNEAAERIATGIFTDEHQLLAAA